MIRMFIHWLLSALVLFGIAQLLPGMHLRNFLTALIAVIAIGIVNGLIKPIVSLISLPVTFLTLGLFTIVINAAMLGLAAWFVPGFEISNGLTAILASILLGFGSGLVDKVLGSKPVASSGNAI